MQRYWVYQAAGWFGYSAIGITINLLIGGESPGPLLAGHLALVTFGIGLTHLLRREIQRRRPAGTSGKALWPFLTASTLAISIILASLVIGMNIALAKGQWDRVEVAALWWGMFLAVGVWTVLYLRFSDQRRHQAREGQLQLALREAQLRELESQINPHFLFNCLNSIRALVELDPPRAQDMLTRLSNVLRNSLRHDSQHTVLLSSELQAVADYLALESVRFAGRLNATVQVEAAAAQCRIPPMVLQTLVENAIKHGIGRCKGPGELIVQATVEDQLLLLAVENTGTLQQPKEDANPLGLKNIRQRLQLLYGGRASLRLEAQGPRVRATVAIPVAG